MIRFDPTIPQPLFLAEYLGRVEQFCVGQPLMERAGKAAAHLCRQLLDGLPGQQRVLVLAGPGNNGGDALVVARHLMAGGVDAVVYGLSGTGPRPADAARAESAWEAAGGVALPAMPEPAGFDLVVDGLFGAGLSRELSGAALAAVTRVNEAGVPVLALDVPSGLHGDTGRVLGGCVRASHTLAFIGLRPGLLTLDGPDHAGQLHLDTLGLEPSALVPPPGRTVGADTLASVVTARRRNSHKGSYGSVLVLGGAPGMAGAALLAGRAALLAGAGRVHVMMLDPRAPSVDGVQPELMLRTGLDTVTLEQASAVVAGPGLGRSPEAMAALEHCIHAPAPLLLDADALNLLASQPALAARVRARTAPTLATPHPAEAARLLGCTVATVQADRIASAGAIAAALNAGVVLKGAGSVCASPGHPWYVNPTGNPGMATAGMGDVLSGLAGAFLARGGEPFEALRAAVYLHGAAGDRLAADVGGHHGLTAGETALAARRELNRLAG